MHQNRRLKAVLLYHRNWYASVPLRYSVHLKEHYENLSLVLNKNNYVMHVWTICGDLKIIFMNMANILSNNVSFVNGLSVIRLNIRLKKNDQKQKFLSQE